MNKRTKYTKADEGFIRANFDKLSDAEFAKIFGITENAFQQKRRKLNCLRNPEENAGRFKTGHKSSYKNTKPNSGSFKKGQLPHNTREVGYQRLSKDGYIEIRTEKGFRLLHRIVWETHFGEVPKNHCIIFRDATKKIRK